MASDSRQFERAMAVWEDFHENGYYSDPLEVGRMAILCAYGVDAYDEEDPAVCVKWAKQDAKDFRKEAIALTELANDSGKDTVTVFNPTAHDVREVLRDPTISDIQVIGHGNLSEVFLSKLDGTYDWRDAQLDATHLKTGKFVQRFCGHIARELPVPLGTFVVSGHQDVIAPVGRYFNPRGLLHPQTEWLRPFSSEPRASYMSVKNLWHLYADDTELT